MAGKQERGSDVIERGDIFFFYRPKVEKEEVQGKRDVERFYIVLNPDGKKQYRLIIVGRKEMPEAERHERNWAFVAQVAENPKQIRETLESEQYETKTRGEREVGPARPAGEGVYAIVRHDNHTHLAYSLELPDEPGRVQRDFNIEEEGSYVISVKNPEKGSPPRAGLSEEQKAGFPKKLMEVFRDRKFADVDPVDFLDYEGAELMLVGAREDTSRELGVDLKPEDESEKTADIFKDLRLSRKEHPLKPLFEGTWE